jgi:protein-tyrosine phosphatase
MARRYRNVHEFAEGASYLEGVRVELHFHLLPGVDDGPRDEDDALALARAAAADGTGLVVATPHAAFVDPMELADRVAALRVPIAVWPGAELLAADVLRLTPRELDLVAQGPPGRRWVLFEAPLEGGLDGVADALGRLASLGLGVLIAHPERCPGWWSGCALDEARAAGAALQVNASSLLGDHGPEAARRAAALIRDGRATVLASDAHGAHRPPCLSAALALLGGAGEALVRDRPAALLREGLRSAIAA